MNPNRWNHTAYTDFVEAVTSGITLYDSDFRDNAAVLKPLLYDVSGMVLNDSNRKEIIEAHLYEKVGYKRPIKTWQQGLRIYLGYYDKSFFGEHYLGLTYYEHQARWRKNFDLRRHLQLAPRSHGKSKIYSFELPIRDICYVDNIRILHVTNVESEAQKYLLAVRRQFESNERIIEDFGDLTKGVDDATGLEYPLSGTWSKAMFYVRRSDSTLKDPTLQAIGAGQAITGARFNRILGDDVIEEGDCDSIKKREEMEAWWNAVILELLDADGKALMIGTRKHGDDLYERTQNKPTWTYQIDKAIKKYPTSYEYVTEPDENGIQKLVKIVHSGDGEVLAPDMWSMEKLLEKKLENATTPWKFDREQQQEVTEEKNKIFQREWMNNDYEFLPDGNILRLCDNQIVNPDQMVIVDGTDLAISKNDKADFFTNVTIAMDDRFNTYILDCIKNKFTFDEQKESIVNQHRTWGSQLVGVEAVQYQTALSQHLAFTTEVPVVEVPRVKDKIQRAFGIQPYFQNRKVFFRKGKHGLIKEELNDFPDSPHDDVFDGLETAMHLAVERVRKTKAIREAKMVKSTTVEQFRDPKVIEERLGAW